MMHQAKKELILEHAKQGGFPANSVSRFANVISRLQLNKIYSPLKCLREIKSINIITADCFVPRNDEKQNIYISFSLLLTKALLLFE